MTRRPLVMVAVALLLGACHGSAKSGGGGGSDGGVVVPPFEAVRPQSYVAKVKYLLTGLPVTNDELTAVNASPDALGGLVDSWLMLPEADTKLIEFLGNAFQQTQMTGD